MVETDKPPVTRVIGSAGGMCGGYGRRCCAVRLKVAKRDVQSSHLRKKDRERMRRWMSTELFGVIISYHIHLSIICEHIYNVGCQLCVSQAGGRGAAWCWTMEQGRVPVREIRFHSVQSRKPPQSALADVRFDWSLAKLMEFWDKKPCLQALVLALESDNHLKGSG